MTEQVTITVDGAPVVTTQGLSVAAALIDSGTVAWRNTRSGKPRGLFCGIGVCFDCLAEVDGVPQTRACLVPVRPGMTVCTADAAGEKEEGR